MPNSKTISNAAIQADPQILIELYYADLLEMIRYACLRFHRLPTPDQLEDLRNGLVLLLLKDDCHRLRTFDPAKASYKTWLMTVADNYVLLNFKHQRTWDSLEETLPEKLLEQPKQERNLISLEQRTAVAKEIAKLSDHQRRLITLICDDLPVAEIAKRLNIKPESVHRMKHQIIQKLKAGLNKERGCKSRVRAAQKNNGNNNNNESRFPFVETI